MVGAVRSADLALIDEVLENRCDGSEDDADDRFTGVRLVRDRTAEHDVIIEKRDGGVEVTGLDGLAELVHGSVPFVVRKTGRLRR